MQQSKQTRRRLVDGKSAAKMRSDTNLSSQTQAAVAKKNLVLKQFGYQLRRRFQRLSYQELDAD